jgi:hypothetical protein
VLRAPMLAPAVQPRGLPPGGHAAGSLQLLLASVERILLAHGLAPRIAKNGFEGGAPLQKGSQ